MLRIPFNKSRTYDKTVQIMQQDSVKQTGLEREDVQEETIKKLDTPV